MPVVGDASGWGFLGDLVPQVIDLILHCWGTFVSPSLTESEPNTTRRFRSHLVQAKKLRRLPLLIDREVPEDDLQSAIEKGRLDIRFTAGYHEDVYLPSSASDLACICPPVGGRWPRNTLRRA